MAASFNPTPAEANVLAQIRQHESSGNYGVTISPATCLQLTGGTVCTASGAYQFIDSTWAQASAATGVPYYPTAAAAPPEVQDINALWLLRKYGPNASQSWGGGGVYYDTSGLTDGSITDGGTQPIFDVSGADAAQPTANILDQIGNLAAVSSIDPQTLQNVLLAAGAAAIVWYVMEGRL